MYDLKKIIQKTRFFYKIWGKFLNVRHIYPKQTKWFT